MHTREEGNNESGEEYKNLLQNQYEAEETKSKKDIVQEVSRNGNSEIRGSQTGGGCFETTGCY